jgi:hypothetical protein
MTIIRMSRLDCSQSSRAFISEGDEMGAFNDLTGQTFGFLKVLERVWRRKQPRRTFWRCVCTRKRAKGKVCGKRPVVRADGLSTGTTVSCGCYRYEVLPGVWRDHITAESHKITGGKLRGRTFPRGPNQDLTGQVFGSLTVKKLATERKGGHYCWMCICRCGKPTCKKILSSVRGSALTNGQQTSCGAARGGRKTQK